MLSLVAASVAGWSVRREEGLRTLNGGSDRDLGQHSVVAEATTCTCSSPSTTLADHHNHYSCTDGHNAWCSTHQKCYTSEPWLRSCPLDGCGEPVPENSPCSRGCKGAGGCGFATACQKIHDYGACPWPETSGPWSGTYWAIYMDSE